MATENRGQRGIEPSLAALDPFLTRSWPDAPAEAQSLLRRLDTLLPALQWGDRRITVFGGFKTGKSSLINALAGAPVLPVRSQEGTRAVTRIQYGEAFHARVERSGSGEVIAAHEVADRILRGNGLNTEVVIKAPLPLLDHLWELEDTPGLFRTEEMTERSMSRLDRTDLAILVLAADQILSARERAAATQINRLLRGNVIYAVNRIDTVEQNERADVLAWARHSLEGSGNTLVGRPCLVALSTRAEQLEGIDEMHARLMELCTTELGERMAILSRLGRLEVALTDIAAELAETAGRQEAALAGARAGSREMLERERREIEHRIGQGRKRLQTERESLSALDGGFLSRCVDDTWSALQEAPKGASQGLVLSGALSWYQERVTEGALGVVLDLPVTAKPWDLSTWLVRAEVRLASHPAAELGTALGDLLTRPVDRGQRGREVGKSLGGWLDRNVLGVDVEAETKKRIERAAREVLPALQAEAGEYIGHVEALLGEAERYYEHWTHFSPQVAQLEREADAYRQLSAWLEEFLHAVRGLIAEIGGDS